jgi:hypothetical protein
MKIVTGAAPSLSSSAPDAITHGQSGAAGSSSDASRADHEHAMEAAGGGNGLLWVPPNFGAGTSVTVPESFNNYGTGENANTSQVTQIYFTLLIPSDFSTLVSAAIVMLTTSATNLRNDVATSFAAKDEAFNAHTDSIAENTFAMGENTIEHLNIAGALTGLAAGDVLGILLTRHGDDAADTVGTLDVLGVYIEYSS